MKEKSELCGEGGGDGHWELEGEVSGRNAAWTLRMADFGFSDIL